MAKAYFDVSGVLLLDLLNLPEGTEFNGLEVSLNDVVRFYVEHPDLPDVAEGDALTRCTPVFRSVYQTAFEFEDWGL